MHFLNTHVEIPNRTKYDSDNEFSYISLILFPPEKKAENNFTVDKALSSLWYVSCGCRSIETQIHIKSASM